MVDSTFASFTWEPRWHANPDAPCASLSECGDEVVLVFAAGVISMTQSDRVYVASQLRVAAHLLDSSTDVDSATCALAWHDATCPEGVECRDRRQHASGSSLANSELLAKFVEHYISLTTSNVVSKPLLT